MTFTALCHRDVHGGGGRVVDVNLGESLAQLIESATPTYDHLGTVVVRSGSRFDASASRNCHRSKDGAMASAVLGLTAHDAACPQRRRMPRPHLAPEIDDATHPRDLSEGQEIALVLAIQLSAAPRVLLLDEQPCGLDYRAKTEPVRIVDALAAQGRTVVISTHDVEFAARAADRVVVMADGDVVADGPTSEVIVAGPAVLTTFRRAARRARFRAPVRFDGPKLSDSRGR